MKGKSKRLQRVISFFTAGFLPKAKRNASQSKNRGKIALTYLITFIAGSITPPVSAIISDRLGISEPRLVHVGGAPSTPLLAIKEDVTGRHHLHITLRPVFINKGFKSGHVESAKAAVSGLKGQPEKLQLVHLDKTQLGWLERREIRCEFLVEITPAMMMPDATPSQLVFVVYFYGSNGNQLYSEGIRIDGWRQTA